MGLKCVKKETKNKQKKRKLKSNSDHVNKLMEVFYTSGRKDVFVA